MAAKLVLEPIFEADFCPTSYGFRPGRRAQDAIEEVRFFINHPRSYEWVIEGDVEDCFGQIHHGLLMEQVRRRVTDKRVLGLIRQFLAAGVMTELGTVTATPSGTPQGAILSPLLCEHRPLGTRPPLRGGLDVHARTRSGARDRAKGHPSYRMIRYADDFVVLVRGTQAQAQAIKEQTAEFMRGADALDALAREDARHPRRRRLRPARVPHRAGALARPSKRRRLHVPEQTSARATSCTASRR